MTSWRNSSINTQTDRVTVFVTVHGVGVWLGSEAEDDNDDNDIKETKNHDCRTFNDERVTRSEDLIQPTPAYILKNSFISRPPELLEFQIMLSPK